MNDSNDDHTTTDSINSENYDDPHGFVNPGLYVVVLEPGDRPSEGQFFGVHGYDADQEMFAVETEIPDEAGVVSKERMEAAVASGTLAPVDHPDALSAFLLAGPDGTVQPAESDENGGEGE